MSIVWAGICIALVAVAAAALLRAARCPGSAVIGGLLVGLMLGPTVAGRIIPLQYERIMVAGVSGAEARRQMEIAREVGANETAVAEHQATWDAARERHQQPLRYAVALLVGLVLLSAGCAPAGKHDPRQGWIAPLTIGLWSALLPGGIAFLVLSQFLDVPTPESLLVAAATAIGPWALSADDRAAADMAEYGGSRMIRNAGRVATVIAFVALAAALFVSQHTPVILIALLAAPLAWMMRIIIKPNATVTVTRHARRLLLPPLAALTALHFDLVAQFQFWPAILLVILSADGRWIGAYFGALLPGGRTSLRTMRLVMGAMAAGPTQLCVAALLGWANLVDGSLLIALTAGVVVIELSAPARTAAVRRILEAEQELDDVRRDA